MPQWFLAAQAVKTKKQMLSFQLENTGALLTAGLLIIGRIKGIDRPGLLVTLPVYNKIWQRIQSDGCWVLMQILNLKIFTNMLF